MRVAERKVLEGVQFNMFAWLSVDDDLRTLQRSAFDRIALNDQLGVTWSDELVAKYDVTGIIAPDDKFTVAK